MNAHWKKLASLGLIAGGILCSVNQVRADDQPVLPGTTTEIKKTTTEDVPATSEIKKTVKKEYNADGSEVKKIKVEKDNADGTEVKKTVIKKDVPDQ